MVFNKRKWWPHNATENHGGLFCENSKFLDQELKETARKLETQTINFTRKKETIHQFTKPKKKWEKWSKIKKVVTPHKIHCSYDYECRSTLTYLMSSLPVTTNIRIINKYSYATENLLNPLTPEGFTRAPTPKFPALLQHLSQTSEWKK